MLEILRDSWVFLSDTCILDLTVVLCREPPPIGPTISRVSSASTLLTGQQQPLAIDKPTVLHPLSLHNTVSPSSRSLPRIITQTSSHSTATLSSGSPGGSVGLDESTNSRPHGSSRPLIQIPPSIVDRWRPDGDKQQGGPGGHVSRRPSHRSTGTSEPASPLPVDPQAFNREDLWAGRIRGKVRDRLGGTGKPGTSLQNRLGGKEAPRRDTSDNGSRELSVCELVLTLTLV